MTFTTHSAGTNWNSGASREQMDEGFEVVEQGSDGQSNNDGRLTGKTFPSDDDVVKSSD